MIVSFLRTLLLLSAAAFAEFNPLHHLGANSPWFPAPNVHNISPDVPSGCYVGQAVYAVRHGSRYPDPSAYEQRFQSAQYNASGSLSFLPKWAPVLKYPSQQLSQESLGGHQELYNLGVQLRWRYPTFYEDNTPYLLWTNDYPRVIDSGRLFARAYLGPNSSYGDVYVVNADVLSSVGNSLATSDSCPRFLDPSGGNNATDWDNKYLPPITARLNELLSGNLSLNTTDVSLFPYLCGFETQITGIVSPWCGVFNEEEILQYEYRQDLRYYYGTGPSASKNMTVQFPVLQGIVELLQKGPNVTATARNSTITLPPLIMAFIQDNQVNELASIIGVFDDQKPLSPTSLDSDRTYISSNITPMRGTIAFERLNCSVCSKNKNGTGGLFVRLRLNDAVYPVTSCQSGPGKSCPLNQYAQYVTDKYNEYGSFASVCNLPPENVTVSSTGAVTFFTDLTLPFLSIVKP